MTWTARPGAAAGTSLSGSGGLGWQRWAACKGEDPRLFFRRDPEPGTDPEAFAAAEMAREAKARAICAGCPVRAQCGLFAVATGQPCGIWAGEEREPARPPVPVAGQRLCRNQLHPMTAANTRNRNDGTTYCLACRTASDARYRQRKQERGVAA